MYDKETGERIMGFDLASCPDITCETTIVGDNHIEHLNDLSAEFSVNIVYPRFSRKKFVKKLMSVGISRNIANEFAEFCVKIKKSYGQQWVEFCWASVL